MHMAKAFCYLTGRAWGLMFEFFLWKAIEALIQCVSWRSLAVQWVVGTRYARYIISSLQGKVAGLFMDLSSIDSTGQGPAISNTQSEAQTVNNLHINLELCRITPDFLLPDFSFLSALPFIKIRFLLAIVYSKTEQRHSQMDTYKYGCLLGMCLGFWFCNTYFNFTYPRAHVQ